jgi:hypothetical protein
MRADRLPTCPDCSDTGLIEAPATRVRYGRYANSTEIIAAVAAGPMTIPNRCHLCDTVPTVAVFAISQGARR